MRRKRDRNRGIGDFHVVFVYDALECIIYTYRLGLHAGHRQKLERKMGLASVKTNIQNKRRKCHIHARIYSSLYAKQLRLEGSRQESKETF